MDVIIESWPQLQHGLGETIKYSIIGVILATVVGLIFALFRLTRVWPLRWISIAYVELFRGTPLLIQIMFINFGLPLAFPFLWDIFPNTYTYIAASAALAFNEGAYITEIIRAGILSVDRGQREAAQSVGMNEYQTMVFIILPQAFKRMIPPLVNQFAQTIKDTSLLSVIAITELIYSGQIIVSANFAALQIYGAIAILYFILIFIVSRVAGWLEVKLQIDKR